MGTLKPQSNGSLYSNTVIGTLAVDGWAVTFGAAMRGLGGALARPGPSSLYQNVTLYPLTANVTTSVLLYNGPLLCGFNVPIKGLTCCHSDSLHL